MNWKLILSLSFLGLVMGYVTIYWVPSKIEPLLWLAIAIYSAYRLAVDAGKRFFLHGFLVNLLNSIWVIALHIFWLAPYLAHHTTEAAQFAKLHSESGMNTPALIVFFGLAFGLISGLALGLFATIASKMMERV